MRYLFILMLSLSIACNNISEQGFTNVSEAKNENVNGVKHGKWIEYLDSNRNIVGDPMDATSYRLIIYDMGIPIGTVHYYYKPILDWQNSGKIEEVSHYTNGKLNGLSRSYYKDGKLQREDSCYIGGKLNGLTKWYYESGKIQEEQPYINDTLNGIEKAYYQNGKLEFEMPFTNGMTRQNGVFRRYHSNGTPEIEIPYKNGEVEGVVKNYSDSGHIKQLMTYSKGKLNGLYKEYYTDGGIKIETTYLNDSALSTRNYDENGNEIKK